MKIQSIRGRLPLTYAGIALITALVLGGALMVILRGYYAQSEQVYLRTNALAVSEAISPLITIDPVPVGLNEHIRLYALLSRTRVRLTDGEGRLIADSGDTRRYATFTVSAVSVPDKAFAGESGILVERRSEAVPVPPGKAPEFPYPPDAAAQGVIGLSIGVPLEGEQPAVVPFTKGVPPEKLKIFYSKAPWEIRAELPAPNKEDVVFIQGAAPGTMVSVIPVAGSIYGYELQPDSGQLDRRSDQVVRQEIRSSRGGLLGVVEVSEGPAYGSEIVSGVAQGWLFSSLVAVLIAALVGWVISRRISAPVLALTAVTHRMADGDLSARAAVQSADEFGELAVSFNHMVERVEETVSALRRFAGDAAHELHTPLTALRTNLELAAGELPSSASSPSLARAWEQVLRLESVTNDLLDLSRIEAGANNAGPAAPLELGALVAQVCEPYASQAEQAGLDFQLDLPQEPLMVRGEAGQLSRALGNLLENALKFSPPGGRVSVELLSTGAQAEVRVCDTGIGIPPDEAAFLFNRFHRARNAAGYPGSGLGLAIVKAIADRHAGQISVQSADGQTCFILCLPLIP